MSRSHGKPGMGEASPAARGAGAPAPANPLLAGSARRPLRGRRREARRARRSHRRNPGVGAGARGRRAGVARCRPRAAYTRGGRPVPGALLRRAAGHDDCADGGAVAADHLHAAGAAARAPAHAVRGRGGVRMLDTLPVFVPFTAEPARAYAAGSLFVIEGEGVGREVAGWVRSTLLRMRPHYAGTPVDWQEVESAAWLAAAKAFSRSEEHTSGLQS